MLDMLDRLETSRDYRAIIPLSFLQIQICILFLFHERQKSDV